MFFLPPSLWSRTQWNFEKSNPIETKTLPSISLVGITGGWCHFFILSDAFLNGSPLTATVLSMFTDSLVHWETVEVCYLPSWSSQLRSPLLSSKVCFPVQLSLRDLLSILSDPLSNNAWHIASWLMDLSLTDSLSSATVTLQLKVGTEDMFRQSRGSSALG